MNQKTKIETKLWYLWSFKKNPTNLLAILLLLYCMYTSFFFWLHPRHVEVAGPVTQTTTVNTGSLTCYTTGEHLHLFLKIYKIIIMVIASLSKTYLEGRKWSEWRENETEVWEEGVPVVAHRLRTWLVSMRMWVWSLALFSGLRIWSCLKPGHGLQMQLGSSVAIAMV